MQKIQRTGDGRLVWVLPELTLMFRELYNVRYPQQTGP